MIRYHTRIKLPRNNVLFCLLGMMGIIMLMAQLNKILSTRPNISASSVRVFSEEEQYGRHLTLPTPHKFETKSLPNQALAVRFAERRRRVLEICKRLKLTKQPGVRNTSERFIFPTNSSPIAIFCPVPKTGTTFLKKVFAVFNRHTDQVIWTERFNVRPVDDYEKAVMFFFTREPYSRILSAYIDKLWVPNLQFWKGLGREIKEKVRLNISRKYIRCGHDVTFPEIIKYVLYGLEGGDRVNPHFMPTNTFCEVCDYDYDFIGHLETFREDAAYILNAINVTTIRGMSDDNDTITDYITQAYITIFYDRSICASKDAVLRRTWRALQLRGLISLEIPFPLPPNTAGVLHQTVFRLLVEKAVTLSAAIFAARGAKSSQSGDTFESHAMATESHDAQTVQSSALLRGRAEQRKLVLLSAYSLVPLEDRKRLSDLMSLEFELFGYEPQPRDIFAPSSMINRKIFDLDTV